jgi:hypothetical protein
MDGWWECEKLDDFSAGLFRPGLRIKLKRTGSSFFIFSAPRSLNRSSQSKAFQIGKDIMI